jgi:hypothetical protein
LPFADFAAGWAASVAMSAASGVAEACCLIGALTVVQSLFISGFSLGATKNPRQLICCTRVARRFWIASDAEGQVRHQRAD